MSSEDTQQQNGTDAARENPGHAPNLPSAENPDGLTGLHTGRPAKYPNLIFCRLPGLGQGGMDEFPEIFGRLHQVRFTQIQHMPAAITFPMKTIL
jgi:hypothetical protein